MPVYPGATGFPFASYLMGFDEWYYTAGNTGWAGYDPLTMQMMSYPEAANLYYSEYYPQQMAILAGTQVPEGTVNANLPYPGGEAPIVPINSPPPNPPPGTGLPPPSNEGGNAPSPEWPAEPPPDWPPGEPWPPQIPSDIETPVGGGGFPIPPEVIAGAGAAGIGGVIIGAGSGGPAAPEGTPPPEVEYPEIDPETGEPIFRTEGTAELPPPESPFPEEIIALPPDTGPPIFEPPPIPGPLNWPPTPPPVEPPMPTAPPPVYTPDTGVPVFRAEGVAPRPAPGGAMPPIAPSPPRTFRLPPPGTPPPPPEIPLPPELPPEIPTPPVTPPGTPPPPPGGGLPGGLPPFDGGGGGGGGAPMPATNYPVVGDNTLLQSLFAQQAYQPTLVPNIGYFLRGGIF